MMKNFRNSKITKNNNNIVNVLIMLTSTKHKYKNKNKNDRRRSIRPFRRIRRRINSTIIRIIKNKNQSTTNNR